MNKKRVLIVTVSLSSGGLERIVANIANRFSNKGCEVLILTLLNPNGEVFVKLEDDVKYINFKDIKVNASGMDKFKTTLKWISFIKQNINDFDPDYILAMTIKIGSMVIIANKKRRARVVVREISDPKSKARNQLMNKICFHYCKKADGFIFQTDWERSCFPKRIQRIGKVIPNPAVLSEYAVTPKRNAIVTMGRLLNFQKCHLDLIKAFSIFKKNHPEYVLEIYGEGPDKVVDEELVAKLNLTDSVRFMGACKNVHSQIKDAKCFILTSDYEGLSNALLEAYLMGIPSISSDWPGVSEVINDRVDGLIVKRGDINGYAKAMSEICDNEELAYKLSENAKKQKNKYDSEEVFSKYISMIEGS